MPVLSHMNVRFQLKSVTKENGRRTLHIPGVPLKRTKCVLPHSLRTIICFYSIVKMRTNRLYLSTDNLVLPHS